MEQLTLQQLFGVNAYQDSQVLSISKPDLPGLTPSANNSAESLLVAILLASWRNFQGVIEDENGNAITDENGIPIAFDNQNIYELLNLFRWNESFRNRGNELMIVASIIIEYYAPN